MLLQANEASQPSTQPPASSQYFADSSRSNGRKRTAAAQSGYAAGFQADYASDSSNSSVKQGQEHKPFFQHGQRAQVPVAASYGPEEQAEAKRQANKEAALTWLDRAKAAAASRDWTAAVSHRYITEDCACLLTPLRSQD